MPIHPLAGKPAQPEMLADLPALRKAYYEVRPEASDPIQRVAFGTSGHRGSSLNASFNEAHILAISQALCEFRKERGTDGPLFIGMDTHALSEPALRTSIEVFAAQGVTVLVQSGGRYTPTPVISHAILTYNRGRTSGLGDGVVITPSHNPPEDGGFKYNPPEGGPAGTGVTQAIERRANALLAGPVEKIRRIPWERARWEGKIQEVDYILPYVADLAQAIDLEAIAAAGLRIGVDPLGGSSLDFWDPIAERYGLTIEVVNRRLDATFSFMTLDRDGKIRMDCSSPYAMAGLIGLKDRFDIAFGNDADADRHGIVTPGLGLMNPNHYLAAAADYLFRHRPSWPLGATVGKTLVSTAMLDRVAASLGRPLYETPVGFKWFVPRLLDGTCGFGGEESAGASFLRKDGTVWSTDKDGILMSLLACELTARLSKDPARLYGELEERFGSCFYERLDAPASPPQKALLAGLMPESLGLKELAGEPVLAAFTAAPGNQAPIGGLKVTAANGWFALRPSGTEDIYKLYAESFR
ncbi:MAG: phosphoglucomutase (alpha-D-glucose-1,6-bisphosphate-dependent), partial [Syntrophaceae bacterium]|nr:phosphoglucomutase (alpha-D-glucose-1,6-bisphosphate-dependent) [Syntrophaceae bacterium]